MPENTLRAEILAALAELDMLLEVCEDAEQSYTLRIYMRELSAQLDASILANLNAATPDFEAALTALRELTDEAKQAKSKLDRVVEVINKAAKVVGRLERLAKTVHKTLK
jgi:predicted phage-related endonuclease